MLTKKILNIDHTYFRCKNQAKNKYIIPHKNLKVTITYKKVDQGRVKKIEKSLK